METVAETEPEPVWEENNPETTAETEPETISETNSIETEATAVETEPAEEAAPTVAETEPAVETILETAAETAPEVNPAETEPTVAETAPAEEAAPTVAETEPAVETISAEAEAYAASSGTCGESVTWTLDDTGTLTISGSGAMTHYAQPWYSQRKGILSIVIESGVTIIGSFAFQNCVNLTTVTIPTSVTVVGWCAFSGCSSLTDVYYEGTASERTKNNETIADENDALTNANWHYKVHVLELIKAKIASCTAVGNNAYYVCSLCGKCFKDEAGTTETTVEAETIAMIAHSYVDGKCTMCGAEESNSSATVSTVAITRLYNPNTGEHLLASSDVEINLLTSAGWSIDGIMCSMPTSGTPIYRLYNPYSGEHLYTMVEAEISNLTSLGWTVDGIIAYSAASGGTPIYRLYNSSAAEISSHLLSTSQEEMNNLVASGGWVIEGIALYAA